METKIYWSDIEYQLERLLPNYIESIDEQDELISEIMGIIRSNVEYKG